MRGSAVAVGVLLGAAAGLLLAPRSGAETRARLRRASRDLAHRAAAPLQTVVAEVAGRVRGYPAGLEAGSPCAPTL